MYKGISVKIGSICWLNLWSLIHQIHRPCNPVTPLTTQPTWKTDKDEGCILEKKLCAWIWSPSININNPWENKEIILILSLFCVVFCLSVMKPSLFLPFRGKCSLATGRYHAEQNIWHMCSFSPIISVQLSVRWSFLCVPVFRSKELKMVHITSCWQMVKADNKVLTGFWVCLQNYLTNHWTFVNKTCRK